MRQKNRDQGVPLQELTLDVTDHDRERAEDIVAELERLGVYEKAALGQEPEAREAPEVDASEPPEVDASEPPEVDASPQREKLLTDIWGNPITKRKGRRR